MSALDALQNLDFSDRTTQLAALAGVGIAGYLIFAHHGAPASDPQAAAADAVRNAQPDLSNINLPPGNSQNYPGWVGYPDLPSTSPTTPTPPTPTPTPTPTPKPAGPCGKGQTAIWRNGKLECRATSTNTKQQCPPGYTPIKSKAGSRCAKVSEFGNTPGPTSYIPVDLKGTYQKGYRGMSPAGAAGEAFTDRWLGRGGDAGPNPYGSVRGFNPLPHPIGSARGITVQDGDSLSSIARRLYGNPTFWPMLVERNGAAAANLAVGSTLKG